jgi:hypothetical protein
MDSEVVAAGALTIAAIESFLADWRAAGGRRVPTVRALRSLLTFLREVGVMAGEEPPVPHRSRRPTSGGHSGPTVEARRNAHEASAHGPAQR